MVPWQKLPDDLQKAVLALVVLSGSGAVASCRPMVCDPAPPPRMTPTPTMTPTSSVTPMICDPAPPPTITRTPTITPMICDPAPPPTTTPTPTMMPASTLTPMICDPPPPPGGKATMTPMVCDPPPPPVLSPRPEPTAEAAMPGFKAQAVQIISNGMQEGIEVRGKVTDRQGNPMRQVRIALAAPNIEISSRTNSDGAYRLSFSRPGSYQMLVGTDRSHSVPLDLKPHDLATVDWVAVSTESRAPLPLAEIRTVKIAQIADGAAASSGLAFAAASPWPDADYRWRVSGGTLTGMGPRIRWQSPADPGRYLLQVVADWDYAGIAVDAVVLTVAAGGRVTVS
jgi:hypothetical protein